MTTPTYLSQRISWRFSFTYFFTNLESETPFYNIGLGCLMPVGMPTKSSKRHKILNLYLLK